MSEQSHSPGDSTCCESKGASGKSFDLAILGGLAFELQEVVDCRRAHGQR